MESAYIDQYIEEMLQKYSKMIIRIAAGQVNSMTDAEDIAQEVFVKLMTSAPDFENEVHEKAWMIRVTINLCKDYHKNAWNRKREYLNDNIPAREREEEDGLWETVKKLPSKYRNVLYLFYYEDYSINEIAAILKQKESTIGSWLHRARKLLKKELKGGIDYV